jgi:uncharacterized membrane protein
VKRSLSPTVAAGAILLGAASGLRSQMGLTAAIIGSPRSGLPAALRYRGVGVAMGAAALGELVVDKSPKTPDRTALPGLSARLVLGAASGALVASVAGERRLSPALIAGGAACLTAFAGLKARSRLAERLSPLVAGVVEDLAAIQLATGAMALLSRFA